MLDILPACGYPWKVEICKLGIIALRNKNAFGYKVTVCIVRITIWNLECAEYISEVYLFINE